MREYTCCFTGHRSLPQRQLEPIAKRLENAVDTLISQGITNFISGGALGFDSMAASLILRKKAQGAGISLTFMLPCQAEDRFWRRRDQLNYAYLLSQADYIQVISQHYYDGCMKKRNVAMVDNSAYCICALFHGHSGTQQTVDYARSQGLTVISVTD